MPRTTESTDGVREMEAGRELDALVAERVMGAKPLTRYEVARDIHRNDPRYSADVGCAFAVVARVINETGLRFQLGFGMNLAGEVGWYAFFGDPKDASGTGPTAPLAICRAAIAATPPITKESVKESTTETE